MHPCPIQRPVLITGAGGFLGSRLAGHLARTRPVVRADRQALDITHPEAVHALFQAVKPSHVIHAAAISDTQACLNDPEGSWRINVEGALAVAEACKRSGSRLIHLSSDQVFHGNPEPGPHPETREPRPCRPYGQQKHAAEQGILALDPEAVILRLTWLFGLPEPGLPIHGNLVWNLVQALQTHQPLIFSPLEYRGLTYVQDLVERMEALLDLPGGIYHVGSSNDDATHAVAIHALTRLGGTNAISTLLPLPSSETALARDLRMDTQKLQKIGISFPSAHQGIERCIEAFLKA